jgi:hypothetical protein
MTVGEDNGGKCSCPDCGAGKGEKHGNSCDVERCPHCGHQALMCWEESEDGKKTVASCDGKEVLSAERMPWDGRWPGEAECEEYGLYCSMVPGRGWTPCDKSHPEATADLNRLYVEYRWDRNSQKMVPRQQERNTNGNAGRHPAHEREM